MLEKVIGVAVIIALIAVESGVLAYLTDLQFWLVFGVSIVLFAIVTLIIVALVSLITKFRH